MYNKSIPFTTFSHLFSAKKNRNDSRNDSKIPFGLRTRKEGVEGITSSDFDIKRAGSVSCRNEIEVPIRPIPLNLLTQGTR